MEQTKKQNQLSDFGVTPEVPLSWPRCVLDRVEWIPALDIDQKPEPRPAASKAHRLAWSSGLGEPNLQMVIDG